MSVDYRHDYIETYALGGFQQVYPMARAGVLLNGFRFTENASQLSYNLYQFDAFGNVWSVTHYNLYLSWHYGDPTDPDRMIADLNAMENGRVFALVSFDEPYLGHKQQYIGSGTINQPLLDAVYRVGGTPEEYGQDFNYRGAYLLIGKVGEPAYFEKYKGERVVDPAHPDDTNRMGDPQAALYCAFSVVNNKIVPYKHQNNISARISSIWKEGQAFWCKLAGRWMAVRKIFVKSNGVWKKTYVRNAYQLTSMGASQTIIPPYHQPLYLNGHFLTGKGHSYTLVKIDAVGEPTGGTVYDIYYDGTHDTTVNTDRMVADLNAMPYDQLFVIYTWAEPMTGHLHPDLLQAMYRIGATPAIYGQPMAYRGAYMLIGKVGRGNYFEQYIGESVGTGDTAGDPNAAIYKLFTVDSNEVILLRDDWGWGSRVPSLGDSI